MTALREVIVVFAKPAVPGQVKTRLIPPLTSEEAAEFHLAALADVLSVARSVSPEIELRVAGETAALERFRERHPDVTVKSQRGRGLGERLRHAFEAAFKRGAGRVLIVGSDHPSLPADHLRQLLERSNETDVVLGPSEDGGYYAVAIRRASWPLAGALFDSMPWSTPELLSATLDRAADSGLTAQLGPSWYDVDDAEDLERLRRDAEPGSATAAFLRELDWLYEDEA